MKIEFVPMYSCLEECVDYNRNDKLAKLCGTDIQDFLWYIERYSLEYRNVLTLGDKIEIRLKTSFQKPLQEKLFLKSFSPYADKMFSPWEYHSVSDDKAAITSPYPFCYVGDLFWKEFGDICSILRESQVQVGKECSEVSIGTDLLVDEFAWIHFLELWVAYEPIIYRFACGEYVSPNEKIGYFKESYAPLFESFISFMKDRERYTKDGYEETVHQFFMLLKEKGMFTEHRLLKISINHFLIFGLNGSLNPVIWQNTIQFFVALMKCASSKTFDEEMVLKRIQRNHDMTITSAYYNEIYLQQALELGDLLFDNNLDKVYFLKQYLKFFETGYQPLQKAKCFTKTN